MGELLVNIDVDDLDRAVAFYTTAFELTVGRRLEGGAMIELLGASSRIYLLRHAAGSRPAPGAVLRDYARHWTPVHMDVVVLDIDAAVERAQAAGATLEGGVRDEPYGRLATLADPFGHGFCLLQFTGSGYDVIAEGGAQK
jgi:predicted enzyme related to lactoylglutathione lyase